MDKKITTTRMTNPTSSKSWWSSVVIQYVNIETNAVMSFNHYMKCATPWQQLSSNIQETKEHDIFMILYLPFVKLTLVRGRSQAWRCERGKKKTIGCFWQRGDIRCDICPHLMTSWLQFLEPIFIALLHFPGYGLRSLGAYHFISM